MGVRRRTRQDHRWPAIRWQVPSLYVAIVTLVAVTGAVLSDAPPSKAVLSNSQPSDILPLDPVLSPAATSSSPRGRWLIQRTGLPTSVVDVSCANESHCIAVGAAGMILSTSDAGTSWSLGHSGTTHPLVGVSCPSPTVCYAVTNVGELLKTGDAGTSWSISAIGNTTPLAIACPTTADCVTADGSETHDGGATWHQASRPGAVDVTCPTSSRCYAVRNQLGHGVILGRNGGGWTLQAVTPYFLNAVICTGVNTCIAAGGGDSGTNILTTGDGRSWTVRQHKATRQTLFDVGCATVDTCFVVDGTANVLASTDEGQTWAWRSTGIAGNLYAISCPARDSCFVVGSAPASTGGGLVAHFQAEMTR